jgi:AcrR family transcriptional regulator
MPDQPAKAPPKAAAKPKRRARSTPRRVGSEDSKTRQMVVDVTERLMLREGYAAVTSRRVAIEAGVTAPLVHYYFPTLDDLFLAVLRRRAEQQVVRQRRLLAGDEPLRALWTFNTDRRAARFLTEFIGLANHRKSIRSAIAEYAERFRQIELAALEQAVADGVIDLGGLSPAGVLVLLSTSSRGLVNEEAIGMTTGHEEVHALVERLLGLAERPGRPTPAPSSEEDRP